jgi:hypothetical protein
VTLLFTDSFDHYATADILTKYDDLINANSNTQVIESGGRFSNRLKNTNSSNYVTKIIPVARQTIIVGRAFNITGTIATDRTLIALYDGSTLHTDVRFTTNNKIIVTRNGTQLGSDFLTTANTWHYVELKVKIDDSTGTYEARLDGVSVISGTGADTRNGGNATADRVRFGPSVTGNATIDERMDDVYICDDQGSTNNSFLGDVRIECLFPNNNGNSSQLVGSDSNSTDNYLLVDESTPNSDTDYVESSTVGDKDTYAMGNLTSTTGTVYGIQILPYAKKTDAGTRSIKSVTRLSATEEDSADKPLSTGYTYLPDIRETKPGGGAWTITDVNNAEIGVKVSA